MVAGDLTTLENAKGYLGIDVGNTDDDALLERLIAAASKFIASATARPLAKTTYTERRDGGGGTDLFPRHYPVISITSVKVGTEVIPAQATIDGPGWALVDDCVVLTGYVFTKGRANVEIVYVAGYDPIPADLEQAAIELVAWRYTEKGRIGQASISVNGETVAFQTYANSSNVKAVIAAYRMVAV